MHWNRNILCVKFKSFGRDRCSENYPLGMSNRSIHDQLVTDGFYFAKFKKGTYREENSSTFN